MPPKKAKKNGRAKKVEEAKPKESKLTTASKPRGSSRNSADKIQTPNSAKQEEITAYLKDENNNMNGKKEQQEKIVEDEDKHLDSFVSPKKDTQYIGQLLFTQKTMQSKLSTPAAKQGNNSSKLESKTLFTPSQMQRKIWKVSLSGFTKQTKEFNKNAIIELKGEYCENIQPGLDLIVSSKSFTMKTKFCKDSGIPIVSIQWLTDSMKERQFIEDINKYKLKIFEGCKLNILGFSEDDYITIKQSIIENGGDCINDLNEAQKSANPQIDVTVLNSNNNSCSYLNIIKTPATDEKWLRECLNRQQFVYPKHYVINKIDLSQYNLEKEDAVMKRMQEVECSSQDYSYLQNCIFYIHSSNMDEKKQKVITHLISLGGGYYVNQILPCTTHIVTPQYTKTDFSDFIQYGNSIFLVHPEWLQESFFVCKKLYEVDYQPQQVDISQMNSQQLGSQDLKQKNDTNSFISPQQQLVQEMISGISYHRNRSSLSNGLTNIFNNNQVNNTLSRMSSINANQFNGINQVVALANIPENEEQNDKPEKKVKKLTFKQQKALVTPTGNLFKNCYFYLEESQYRGKLNQYKQKIFENQGDILNVKDDKNKEIFHILDDKPSNEKIMAKKSPNVSFYSYRWIDFCIEKKTVVRAVQELQLIHLLPFDQEMPIKEFADITIWCSGYNPNEKLALRESIRIIGAQYEFTQEKTSYLISDKKDCKKIRYLQSEQEILSKEEYEQKWGQIKIVSAYWILECISSGKIVEPEYYKL